MIPTGVEEPLSLVGLNPRFVKVRHIFYEFLAHEAGVTRMERF